MNYYELLGGVFRIPKNRYPRYNNRKNSKIPSTFREQYIIRELLGIFPVGIVRETPSCSLRPDEFNSEAEVQFIPRLDNSIGLKELRGTFGVLELVGCHVGCSLGIYSPLEQYSPSSAYL